MKTPLIFFPIVALGLNLLAADETKKLEPATCGKMTRVHAYDGIYLTGKPSPEDLQAAKKQGVKTVINLRQDREMRGLDEREVVTELGLNYVSLPIGGADELTDQVFDRSRELLNSAERPMLVHCASANRVGAVWLPWRVLDGGLSFEEALAEARKIGLRSAEMERLAKDYIERKRS